jgi:hypothetical protein
MCRSTDSQSVPNKPFVIGGLRLTFNCRVSEADSFSKMAWLCGAHFQSEKLGHLMRGPEYGWDSGPGIDRLRCALRRCPWKRCGELGPARRLGPISVCCTSRFVATAFPAGAWRRREPQCSRLCLRLPRYRYNWPVNHSPRTHGWQRRKQ